MLTHSLIPYVIFLVNYYLFVRRPMATTTSAFLLILPPTATDHGGPPSILGHHLRLVHEGCLPDDG